MAMCGHELLGTCVQQADGSSSHARLLLKLTQLREQDCSCMLYLKRPCMTLAGESFGQRQLQWGGARTGLCVFTEAAQLPAQQAVVQHPHRPARGRAPPRAYVHAIQRARWVCCTVVYCLEQPIAHVRPDLLQP